MYSGTPRPSRTKSRQWAVWGLLLWLPLAGGCSLRKAGVNLIAKSFAASGDVYASDEDPELVRDALPFALKTIESLLAESPDNGNLLLAACSGFTQYSYAFVETDAVLAEGEDYQRARELRQRALKLYQRALHSCHHGLDLVYPDLIAGLKVEPQAAAMRVEKEHLDLAFWTGVSWGAAISNGLDHPELAADVPAVRALLERVLELQPDYGGGAIQEAMISLDALPRELGGSPEQARERFKTAMEMSKNNSAVACVTLARSVSVAEQNREEFEQLLNQALAVDVDALPQRRLANLIAQRRAKSLLSRVDDFFI